MRPLRWTGAAALAGALAWASHGLGAPRVDGPSLRAPVASAARQKTPTTTEPIAAASAPNLEELLRAERLASARISPDGAQVLLGFERQDQPSQGAPWQIANSSAQVWRAGVLTPIALPGGFKPALCDPWSPSGRYVAGFTLRHGVREAAAWDTRTGHAVAFTGSTTSLCLPWAGECLVIPIPPDGAPGGGDSRARAAAAAVARWTAAWSGEAPQVSVSSNDPAFPAPTAPEGGLVLADPATGETTLIAPGDFHSATPSPDGRWLAVVELGPPDPDALDRRSGRLGRLALFDLAGTTPRPVPVAADLDVDEGGLAWDRAGQRLLIGGRAPGAARPGFWTLVPGAGPEPIPLPADVRPGAGLNGAFSTLRPFGWLGDHPAFIGATAGARLAAAADASREHGDQGEALGLYAVVEGRLEPLTRFAHQAVTRFAVTPDAAAVVVADGALWTARPGVRPRRLTPPALKVLALADERPTFGGPYVPQLPQPRVQVLARGARGGLRLLSVDTAAGRRLADDDAEGLTAVAPGADAAVVVRWRGWSARVTRIGRHPATLAALNPRWATRPLPAPRAFAYTAAGRRLTGWILRPATPGVAPPPALVWVYGGASYPLRPPPEARPGEAPTPVFSGPLWASLGYAVIYPSTPLPDAAHGDVGQALAEAAVAAVDAAAAHGWIDPQRVGLIGHSFGGYSVAAILARRGDRFRAAVAMSGPYDFAAAWGARPALEHLVDPGAWDPAEATRASVEHGQIGLGAPPFAAPDRYRAASPLDAADHIKTPLLLTVGDFDHAGTDLAEAERFYAALVRAGDRAVLVRYWGEDHLQDDPWAVRDQWRRFTAWFAHYLGSPSAQPGPPRGAGREARGNDSAHLALAAERTPSALPDRTLAPEPLVGNSRGDAPASVNDRGPGSSDSARPDRTPARPVGQREPASRRNICRGRPRPDRCRTRCGPAPASDR